MQVVLSILALLCWNGLVLGQPAGSVEHVYKQGKARPLSLWVLAPKGFSGPRPAIVLFFGGGWVSGSTHQFDEQALHFAARGMVSVLVDYSVKSRDESTPFDSVRDARSAMRWVRGHAVELGIDPEKMIAAGGSAGGHLAGATAILDGIDDAGDDLKISPVPQALLLFNPVVDTTETGFGSAFIGKNAAQLSLTQHIKPGLPPILLLHGTSDHTVPFANAEEFARRVAASGGDCKLVPFPGADHGFFNSPSFRKGLPEGQYARVMEIVDRFLTRAGF